MTKVAVASNVGPNLIAGHPVAELPQGGAADLRLAASREESSDFLRFWNTEIAPSIKKSGTVTWSYSEEAKPFFEQFVTALASTQKISGIKLSGIDDVEMSDKAAEAVAQMIREQPCLQRVDLHGNRISDKGARALRDAVMTREKMNLLDVSDNDLRNEGVEMMRALKNTFRVKVIHQGDNLTPAEQAARFFKIVFLKPLPALIAALFGVKTGIVHDAKKLGRG